jgi:hypothetical protein
MAQYPLNLEIMILAGFLQFVNCAAEVIYQVMDWFSQEYFTGFDGHLIVHID